jgi:hypothetical protein
MIEMDEELDMNICDDEDPYAEPITPKSEDQNTSKPTDLITAVVSKETKLQIDKRLNKQSKSTDTSPIKEEIPTLKLDQKKAAGNRSTADSLKVKKSAPKTIDFSDDEESEKSIIIKKEKKEVQTEDGEQQLIKQDPDQIQSVVMSEEVIKPKHKTLTFQEDPMQFHAKPRDLAKNALKRPREMDMVSDVAVAAAEANHIFSRVAFSALPLEPKLSALLEKSVAEVI